ncbi:RNA polymerase sigma-70 factor [Paenibacillus terrigena]|uniref:RNA polymerase sigma-70 factor n=1 Tax=Paenibacillus terrigena TaxID=369333 RepID=UPI0028D1ED31|nr:RNA polymerase sigma-70 factor [Paenibacillus terrigena]
MEPKLETLYTTYKPLLHSIAYRMLGSVTEAEDIVQDLFIAYAQSPDSEIRNEKAYLIKMVTNRCINFLRSARKQREVYVGPWLPEPQVSSIEERPDDSFMQRENISYALLVLMEHLTPVERAVFMLRETLDYSYQEIGELLNKTAINCRQIFSRAQKKLQPELTDTTAKADLSERLAMSFIEASRTGDFQSFVTMITEDAILLSDGGGRIRAAINPIFGKERIFAFLHGIHTKRDTSHQVRLVQVNGHPGVLIHVDEKIHSIIAFQLDPSHQKAQSIYLIRNPEKISHFHIR